MTYKILFSSDILLHYKLKSKIVLESLKSLSWPPDDNTPPIYYSYPPYDSLLPQFPLETKTTSDNKKATTTNFTSQLITHQIKPRFKLTPFTFITNYVHKKNIMIVVYDIIVGRKLLKIMS